LYEFDEGSGKTTCKSTASTYDDDTWYNVIGVRDASVNECDLYIYNVAGTLQESVLDQSGSGGTITHDAGDWICS